MADIDDLRSLLRDALGDVLAIEPLSSGTTGSSFLVISASGRYVAKRFDPAAPVLLGPAEQFALLRELEPAGIAPIAVACDVEARVLVTQFVAGATPETAAGLRQPNRLAALVDLLRSLHASRFAAPLFAPAECARRYTDAIGGAASLGTADRRRYDELLRLSALPMPGDSGLCHNDLIADNILFGGHPRLIDFDYAAAGPPILDLASIVVMNAFDDAGAAALLAAYFQGGVPFSAEEFARVQRLIRLLAHFWALAEIAARTTAVTRAADSTDQLDELEQYRIKDD